MQVILCQSDLILLHKWGLDDSQSHTTVSIKNYFPSFYVQASSLQATQNMDVVQLRFEN